MREVTGSRKQVANFGSFKLEQFILPAGVLGEKACIHRVGFYSRYFFISR
ncbi:hypothetical protein [Desulfurococcus sp.]